MQAVQVSQQSLLNSAATPMMSTATPGLGQTQEGMVTSAQSSVASNLGLTFSGVNTGNHNMLSMDQQDNAAVSKRDGIAGSNKFHLPRLISLGQAVISLYRRKALRYGMNSNHTDHTELEQVVHTNRPCRTGWPRRFGALNPSLHS